MLFLNKLLPLFVLPAGIVAMLVLFALWRRKRWPLVVALSVLYLSSIPLVGNGLMGWVETRHPSLALDQVERADAVVVLGGILGARVAENYVPNFHESAERFEAGLVLLQTGKADWLVFTGARSAVKNSTTTEGAELKRIAIRRGVPAEKILVTREIVNTAGEAAAVGEMMKTREWKRVILITTGWHMPRSAVQFRRAGVNCTPFPVDFRIDPARAVTALDFVPRAEAWQQTETALRECYGYVFYLIFG